MRLLFIVIVLFASYCSYSAPSVHRTPDTTTCTDANKKLPKPKKKIIRVFREIFTLLMGSILIWLFTKWLIHLTGLTGGGFWLTLLDINIWIMGSYIILGLLILTLIVAFDIQFGCRPHYPVNLQ